MADFNSLVKPQAGQIFIPSASLTRDTIDVVNDYKKHEIRKPNDPNRAPVPTDLVVIKNASGAARRRGEILEITGIAETTARRDARWFTGGSPTPGLTKRYVVLSNETPNNGFDEAQVSGMAWALVNITSTSHNRCTITASTYVLQSDEDGPIEIVYQPSGTGEKECWVQIGPNITLYKPRIRFTLAAALATTDASKTGTITEQLGIGLDNPNTGAGAITLKNLGQVSGYLYEGASGAAGAATWIGIGNTYLIDALPCP